MRAIGFNQGQFGDLCMNVIACKAFKNQYPDSHFTFGINKKYESISPIFIKNKFIDDIHIWDGYDNWPTQNDLDYLNNNKFDIVFHPMKCLRPRWQPVRHQTEEICLINDLKPPEDLQIELNKYFETKRGYENYISICAWGATDSEKKNLPNSKIDEICSIITKYGYKPLFFQKQYKEFNFIDLPFFEAIKIMLSTKILISIDSAMLWIASGYKFPAIGLYNRNYYSNYGAFTSKNWQPINPNAQYIESDSMLNIDLNLLEENIKNLC
jgi:ADP-heptose:LPS heptosyltransferase